MDAEVYLKSGRGVTIKNITKAEDYDLAVVWEASRTSILYQLTTGFSMVDQLKL